MNKWLALIIKRYSSFNLRTKIVLYFLIVNLVVTIGLGGIYYWKSTRIMQEETAKNIRNTLSRVALDMQNVTDRIRQVSDSVSANANIREFMKKPFDDDDFGQRIADFKTINSILQSFPYNPEVFKINLYFNNPIPYSSNKMNLLSMEHAAVEPWFKAVTEKDGKILWTNTYSYKYYPTWQENIISCVRILKDFEQPDHHIGYVSIDLKERDLYKILELTEEVIGGRLLIVNSDDVILSSRESTLIGQSLQSSYGLQSHALDERKAVEANVRGEHTLVQLRTIPSLDWRIVSFISLESYTENNGIILRFLWQSFIVITLVTLLLAVLISKHVTGRLKKLIDYVRKVDIEEDDDSEVQVTHNDEISSLMISFNHMVTRNRTLIKEVYQEKISKKEAEMRALQAQINPHFLYNTMDTINWMALKYKAADIMKMTQLLSRFYRLSLSEGRDIIPIEDEIEHIKTYIDIQKERFEDDIEAIFDISPDIYHFSTIKLILQPIVENAIFHGIQQTAEQRGQIHIVGRLDDRMIKIYILDDGAGMDSERLEELAANLIESRQLAGSYGLKNVMQRIRLYYGDEFGIRIYSRVGKGTCVEVTWPAVRKQINKTPSS